MISMSQWMITAAEAALKLILDIENLITLLMKLIQSILDLSSGRLTSILVKSFQTNLNDDLTPEEKNNKKGLFLITLLAQRSSRFEILAASGLDEKHCINDAMQCKAEQKLSNICSSRVLCCLLKQRDRRSTHETENKVQLKPSLSVPSTAPQSPIMIDPVSLQLHIVY